MRLMKSIWKLLYDLLEIYIPTLCLIVTFVSFIIQVVSRYVFSSQVAWSYELCLTGFIWCLYLAAGHAMRAHTHVCFTLFYDKLSAGWQLIFRLAGTLFLIVCFGLLVYPAYDWIQFMAIKKSATLHIPMNIVFAPFIAFTVLTLMHLVEDMVRYIREAARFVRAKQAKALEE